MQRQAYSNSQNHTGRPLRTILQRTFLSPCYQGKACSQALDVPLPIAPCTCTGPSAGPAVCRGPCVPSELFLVVQVSGQKKSLHQTRCPAAPERRATEWLRLSIPQHLTVPLKRNFPIGTQQPAPTAIPASAHHHPSKDIPAVEEDLLQQHLHSPTSQPFSLPSAATPFLFPVLTDHQMLLLIAARMQPAFPHLKLLCRPSAHDCTPCNVDCKAANCSGVRAPQCLYPNHFPSLDFLLFNGISVSQNKACCFLVLRLSSAE